MSLHESRPLRVLLLSNLFPSVAEPIRGVFTLRIAEQLRSLCDLRVACPLPWFPRLRPLRRFTRWYPFALVPEQDTISNIPVHYPKYFMVPRVSEGYHAVLMWLGVQRAVKALARQWPFDVINAQWLYPDGVVASWLSRALRVPFVLSGLGCDVNAFLDHAEKRTQILESLVQAKTITVVSRSLRDRIVREGIPDKKVTVIPNGVDGDIFHAQAKDTCRTELALPRDKKLVLFVGQLVEVKGLRYLMEAADRVRKVRSDVLFYLVGEGPDAGTLAQMVQERRLGAHVVFVGRKDHAEIARWMGACDVFCLPSIREGCPNVVMEALSSGRPVVASRVGGVPDLVDESNGVLVKPENSEQLAEAIQQALDRRWNTADIHRSVEAHSWLAAAENYYKVLEATARLGKPADAASPVTFVS